MAPTEALAAPWRAYAATLFSTYPALAAALATIGIYAIVSQLLSFLDLLAQTFVFRGTSLKKFGAKQDAWAVVTGCTDGIGREFALQLAKAGFNVVLASRTQDKLTALASEIESEYKVKTKTSAIDFSKNDNNPGYASLEAALSGLRVGVLVNNVGKSHDIPAYFDETPSEEIDGILEINIHATLKVTRIVLPSMIKRKNGLILNLGSFAGFVPSPMLATYSGSKAFLSVWSQALADEYKSRGITVQNLNTYFVVSSMSKIRRSSMTTPMPKAYVNSVLSKIGVPCGSISNTATSTPYWSHAVMEWVLTKLGMWAWYIRFSHNLHIDIRKRALKRRERDAAGVKKAN